MQLWQNFMSETQNRNWDSSTFWVYQSKWDWKNYFNFILTSTVNWSLTGSKIKALYISKCVWLFNYLYKLLYNLLAYRNSIVLRSIKIHENDEWLSFDNYFFLPFSGYSICTVTSYIFLRNFYFFKRPSGKRVNSKLEVTPPLEIF